MDVFTILKLEGYMVDLIVLVHPDKYSKFIVYKHGEKVLYLKVLKALYGCIK